MPLPVNYTGFGCQKFFCKEWFPYIKASQKKKKADDKTKSSQVLAEINGRVPVYVPVWPNLLLLVFVIK